MKIRHIGTIFPIYFSILILFLLFQVCIRITEVRSRAED